MGHLGDRLVSELRLAHAANLEEASALLATYLPRHNARFVVPAADALFCFHYPRRVARDATVSWSGGALALPRRRDGRSSGGLRGGRRGASRREPVGAPRGGALPTRGRPGRPRAPARAISQPAARASPTCSGCRIRPDWSVLQA